MKRWLRWCFAIALVLCMPAIGRSQTTTSPSPERPLLLQADQGELRFRRPVSAGSRIGIPVKAFLIKVDRFNGGAHDLMFFTDVFPPGAVIPRHRHLRQDEILFIGRGTVLAQVGKLKGRVSDGGTIYIPHNTWVTVKNVGSTKINLLAFFSGSDYDDYMRCASVLPNAENPPITPQARKACAARGNAEYRGL